jgi:pimeloyl-ACP methyl ester carboxylesterase
LGKPALLIHDANDDVVPYSEAEETAQRWAGARLFETRGLGHRRGLKDPRVIEATVEFLRLDKAAGAAHN